MRDLLVDIADYYSTKLAKHGETPLGVDWNGESSQSLRFDQLAKVIEAPANFSLNDLGCGYGALYDYLEPRYPGICYTGCDVSEAMITAALARHCSRDNVRYVVASTPPGVADYTLASGIFNVKLAHDNAAWREYVEAALQALHRFSRLGFAFNCLTSYSDAEKMRDDLYYADPCELFDICKRRFSRHVALLHDYGLYEFTIVVRRKA